MSMKGLLSQSSTNYLCSLRYSSVGIDLRSLARNMFVITVPVHITRAIMINLNAKYCCIFYTLALPKPCLYLRSRKTCTLYSSFEDWCWSTSTSYWSYSSIFWTFTTSSYSWSISCKTSSTSPWPSFAIFQFNFLI